MLGLLGEGTFDALVLGGGITGVCAAHELVARGYRVALVDDRDFASGTSQESSQLVWGGIKYLEHGHVGLVRDLCRDRNALVREHPSRVEPMAFLYPHYAHDPHMLVTLMAGAWLYHALGGGFARRPRGYKAADIQKIVPRMRVADFAYGFQYFDARMKDSDARMALDVLFDAVAEGLVAVNYLEMRGARRVSEGAKGVHEIEFEDAAPGAARDGGAPTVAVRARWIVNATGCWVDGVNERLGVDPPHRHLFSKGIHVVVDRIETGDRALTCLAKDRRPFFVIPWGDVTLIGTTDTPFEEPPRRVTADADDIEYLRRECEAKFDLKLEDSDVLNTKAGLRPLVRPARGAGGDFLALARSHKVWADPRAGVSAAWGGKYTSCFSMAREIADAMGLGPTETARAVREIDPAVLGALRPTDAIVEPDALSTAERREALARACERELVVTLEDLLRRRTNLALKIPNGARGFGNTNADALAPLADAIGAANGRSGGAVLKDYMAAG